MADQDNRAPYRSAIFHQPGGDVIEFDVGIVPAHPNVRICAVECSTEAKHVLTLDDARALRDFLVRWVPA